MHNKVIRSTLLLGLALSAGAAFQPARAQESHPKEGATKSAKSRGEAGAKDENIKKDRQPNDPQAKAVAPPEKGGPKTRSAACHIHMDNRTPWYIDIYTDGDYRGQVSPYGDSTGYVGCGNTTFYGRATFTDGSTKTWGPQIYYVDGSFIWRLDP
jgi:hypothetical protein